MDTKKKLIEYFEQFPGIGPRQAGRFVDYLQNSVPQAVAEIARLIARLQKDTRACAQCCRFFEVEKGQESSCPICRDLNRVKSSLMVVARDADVLQIEKSGAYRGQYFVLGDTVSIMGSAEPTRVRIKELVRHVAESLPRGLSEIIFAFSATPEGEHTKLVLEKEFEKKIKSKLIYSTLARGLSAGLELEYSDSDTITQAVKNRTSHS